MGLPRRSYWMSASTALLGIAALIAACGGGGGGESSGPRVTAPDAVATATPAREPLTYKIRGEQVSTTGGATTIASTGSPTPRPNQTYTVAEGDTCAGIADKFSIKVDDLLRANRTINSNCSNLRTGEQLRIPAPQSATTPVATGPTPRSSGKEYKVQSGDTCADIAANQGVDVKALISLNNLDPNCTNLKIGQVLKIP